MSEDIRDGEEQEEREEDSEGEDQDEGLEVVELESEDGEHEEFAVLDRIEIDNRTYAVMALVEDMERLETLSEEDFMEFYGDAGFFHIMRDEGDAFIEITDEEFDEIKDRLNEKIRELSE